MARRSARGRHHPAGIALDEEQDERDDERVDRARFRQTDADDEGRADVRDGLRVAGDRLGGAHRRDTDADTWAERAHADRDTRTKPLCRIYIESHEPTPP